MPGWVQAMPWWLWPTTVVVVLAAAGLGVVIGHGGVASPPQQQSADADGQPTAAAVQWRKLALPVADIWMPFGLDGPRVEQVGEWSGWSHTQTGAVQAGWMWLVCGALDNAAAADCVRSHYTGAFTESVATLYLNRAVSGRSEGVPVGYDVLTFTPDSARIVYRTTNATMILGVDWVDDDWKIVAGDNETRPRNAAQVAPGEEFQFTPWGPTHA